MADESDELRLELIKTIGDFITFVNENYCFKLLDSNTDFKEPLTFLFTMLCKLNNGLGSCIYFIVHFKVAPYRDSLFLLLRTLISDSISVQYLINKSGNESELIENIKSFNFNHIQFTIKNIQKYGNVLYNHNPKKVQKLVEQIKLDNSDYFNSDGSERYQPLFYTMGNAIGFLISSSPLVSAQNMYVGAFGLYELFSKFEHFGEFSFNLMRKNYDEQHEIEFLVQIVDSILISALGISTATSFCIPYSAPDIKVELNKNYGGFNDFAKRFNDIKNGLTDL